jgi:Na+-translocating ferredoxin:NAD+ oxidoreductase RNF subunit RnfB
MSGFAASAAILGGVGAFFGTMIALARKRLYVWEDPRIDEVNGMLPGANCGACGFAGCRAFAEELIGGATQPAVCTVASPDERTDIASLLGVDVGKAATRVARLLCAGGCDVAPFRAQYLGLQTCRAAAAVAGGGKACAWGCLGLGDCEVACTFDAIVMNEVDLPVVLPEECTACGDCVEVCPKDLFTMMPIEQRLLVQCKNLLEGDDAEAVCSVACNACGRCVADATPGVIEIVDGLAVIDYGRNQDATEHAIDRCPTGAIVWLDGAQRLGADRLAAGVEARAQ